MLYLRSIDLNTLSFILLTLSLFIFPLTSIANEDFDIPMSKQEAISLAKQYVQSNSIDISKHHIGSAEYHFSSGLNSYWQIEWRKNQLVRGGQIIVIVYEDGSIEHYFDR
jgi:hypothetical protein